MAKQGQGYAADDLPDDVRMWAAQEFVLGSQALMDEWHAAGVLSEGHWGTSSASSAGVHKAEVEGTSRSHQCAWQLRWETRTL